MKIAVDLDGVCYEWRRTYRYMMHQYRGVEMPPVDKFWLSWNAPDAYTSKEDRDWIWNEGVELGLFRYGHVLQGAVVGLRQLQALGHSLEVVTHRPSNAVLDTLAWLNYLAIPWSGIHIISNGANKARVSSADLLIDDKPENCEHFVEAGRRAILFHSPANENYEEGPIIQRADGWPGVVEVVRCLS